MVLKSAKLSILTLRTKKTTKKQTKKKKTKKKQKKKKQKNKNEMLGILEHKTGLLVKPVGAFKEI